MKDYIAFYFSKTFPGIDVPASLSKSIRLANSHRSSSVLSATGPGCSSHFLFSGQTRLSAFHLLWNSQLSVISGSRDFSKLLESGPSPHNLASRFIFHHGGTEGIRWCGQRHPHLGRHPFNLSIPCPPIPWPRKRRAQPGQGSGTQALSGRFRERTQHGLLIFC